MKARKVEGLDPLASLRPNAARIVATRLTELLALSGAALDPAAAEAQHDLRIAAKRLRYVLEITGPCFGAEAEAARRAAKELQGVLGEIHDCDVMLSDAENLGSLTRHLRNRRRLLFGRFQDLWREKVDEGVWAALERRSSAGA